MDEQRLLIDDSTPHVRVLTLNRPHRLNAFDGQSHVDMIAAIRGCNEPGRDIRAIVIQGAGRAFSAGNDLKWLAGGVLESSTAHLRNQDNMAEALALLEAAPQIVIASVNGIAVAGGFELLLACDIVVAAEEAEIGDAHLARNLLPTGGSSQRLPQKIGIQRAMYYLVTGRRMSGREAERIGLAALAVPQAELAATSRALAEAIARTDPMGLASMKAMARRSLELPLKDGLLHERWMAYRYKAESPTLVASVKAFAGGGRAD